MLVLVPPQCPMTSHSAWPELPGCIRPPGRGFICPEATLKPYSSPSLGRNVGIGGPQCSTASRSVSWLDPGSSCFTSMLTPLTEYSLQTWTVNATMASNGAGREAESDNALEPHNAGPNKNSYKSLRYPYRPSQVKTFEPSRMTVLIF